MARRFRNTRRYFIIFLSLLVDAVSYVQCPPLHASLILGYTHVFTSREIVILQAMNTLFMSDVRPSNVTHSLHSAPWMAAVGVILTLIYC